MGILVIEIFPAYCHVLSLMSKYFSLTSYSRHSHPMYIPQGEKPSFISMKTEGKIVVLYVLIFRPTFLDRRLEYKIFLIK
jgi:hypothetical protein